MALCGKVAGYQPMEVKFSHTKTNTQEENTKTMVDSGSHNQEADWIWNQSCLFSIPESKSLNTGHLGKPVSKQKFEEASEIPRACHLYQKSLQSG